MRVDVLCVAGARPNFMKVKPVLDALEGAGVICSLVHTGQHYDRGMSTVFFEELGLRTPDHHLDVRSGTHAQQTAAVMLALEPLVDAVRPRAVVVVGDVNSTVATALVAAKAGPLVVHVEAGLRSRDWSMPEEVNRVVTDRLSDLLLAPSADAVDNLRSEGARDEQIALVGNVMIDSLLANLTRARQRPVLDHLDLRRQGYVLATLHRPANVDDPDILDGLLAALSEISRGLPVIFPAHPRTRKLLADASIPPYLLVTEPFGYLDFIALEEGAAVVITDSGGVQEETTALGVPCLTARDTTERPITIAEGTNRVVGRDPATIVAEFHAVRRQPPPARCPALWDGKAGARAADAILEALADPDRARPSAG